MRQPVASIFGVAFVVFTAIPMAGADVAGVDGTASPDPAQIAQETPSGPFEPSDPTIAARRPDASWREIFAGPFPSSRLFSMPTAEVVGAYQISLSGDASLLSESNVLSTSGVVAIGFGDIAQLEYRSSSAVTTLDEDQIRLPTLGVQLEIPYRPRRFVPELAVALRFGLPHTETSADGLITHQENATDLYVVARLVLGRYVVLHGGVRSSFAEILSEGEPLLEDARKTMFLPAAGIELRVTDKTIIAAEVAKVPLFDPGDASRPSDIGAGLFARTGIRWRVVPWLVMDASFGYRIEVERAGSRAGSMADALVDWDIRLGGEIFVPWGAALCRRSRVFCEQ